MVLAEDRRVEQLRPTPRSAGGIDERADPRDGRVDDPASRLHRAHPAHLQVLRADAAVIPYDALLTVTTRNAAPCADHLASDLREGVLEADRRRRTAGGLDVETVRASSPVARSTGIWSIASMKASRARNGTYSPNGTRWALSYRSTWRPSPSKTTTLVYSLPSASRMTAPIDRGHAHGGDDLAARPAMTADRPPRPRSSAPSPHTTRSGGSPAQRAGAGRCCSSATRTSSSAPGPRRATRDVHLDRGDVDLRSRGRRERDRERAASSDAASDDARRRAGDARPS